MTAGGIGCAKGVHLLLVSNFALAVSLGIVFSYVPANNDVVDLRIVPSSTAGMSNSTDNLTQCNCAYVPSAGTADLGIIAGTPITNGPNANFLADSLGVSPLYRQQDTARWQSAAQVYHSSRAHSPVGAQKFTFPELTDSGPRSLRQRSQPNVGDILRPVNPPSSQTMEFRSNSSVSSPISLEDIANMNRKRHAERFAESGGAKPADDLLHGPLELEAISAVHELAYSVQSISVSEILPRTADLIFVNVKTVEEHPYTLELTMKGWRIASTHTDCMNGDYTQVDLHTRYFNNAKEVLEVISPDHARHFNVCLTERLRQLESGSENEKQTGIC